MVRVTALTLIGLLAVLDASAAEGGWARVCGKGGWSGEQLPEAKLDASPLNVVLRAFDLFGWNAETAPLNIDCSIRGWMLYAMVFGHPCAGGTDENWTFELKNLPAGEIEVVARNQSTSSVEMPGPTN